jgi:hypothetical protein
MQQSFPERETNDRRSMLSLDAKSLHEKTTKDRVLILKWESTIANANEELSVEAGFGECARKQRLPRIQPSL